MPVVLELLAAGGQRATTRGIRVARGARELGLCRILRSRSGSSQRESCRKQQRKGGRSKKRQRELARNIEDFHGCTSVGVRIPTRVRRHDRQGKCTRGTPFRRRGPLPIATGSTRLNQSPLPATLRTSLN